MPNRIKILLVEDNLADVELTKENFSSLKILHDLFVANDGKEAMDFLERRGDHENAPRPDLILLDLNLPRMDGRQVLAEIKKDPNLKRIPVVVLSSSSAEEDIVRSYELQASAFVKKPVDLDGFAKIVQGIEDFWFSVVKFPPIDD